MRNRYRVAGAQKIVIWIFCGFAIITVLLCGCGGSKAQDPGGDASEETVQSEDTSTLVPAFDTNREKPALAELKANWAWADAGTDGEDVFDAAGALHLLFDSFFDDEYKEMMQYIDFIDNDVFFGCEYQIYADANPRRIEYWGMSSDQNYHIFWLNEQVYHDGEFSHEVTADFVAVHIETGEIIWEGRDSWDPDNWNDDFPW